MRAAAQINACSTPGLFVRAGLRIHAATSSSSSAARPPPHLPRCMRKPASRTEKHGATPAHRDGCELCTSHCCRAPIFYLFIFPVGSESCRCERNKKKEQREAKLRSHCFVRKKSPSSAKRVCASCAPPPPPAHPMFCHISTTSVPSKPRSV